MYDVENWVINVGHHGNGQGRMLSLTSAPQTVQVYRTICALGNTYTRFNSFNARLIKQVSTCECGIRMRCTTKNAHALMKTQSVTRGIWKVFGTHVTLASSFCP